MMEYSNGKLRLDRVAVDSTTVKACKGELIGYDGYWRVKGTKIHVAVTGESLPISLVVGSGDEHDSRRFREVMDGIRVRCGRGRPRTRPGEVTGDSAYDTRDTRAYLRRRGIKANIPVNIRNRRRPGRGRPYRLDLEAYCREILRMVNKRV